MNTLIWPQSKLSLHIPDVPSISGRFECRESTLCQRPQKSRVLVCSEYDRYRENESSTTSQRRRPQRQYDYDFAPPPGTSQPPPPPRGPPPEPPNNNGDNGNNLKNYLIAGAFFIGMGTGVWFDSTANFTPSNVASTQIIDSKTPNSEVCLASGYSSMVFDQRLFVSFNPFNVYVAQPEVKPGCVLRQSGVKELEKRKLVTNKEVSSCTRSSNTFAFVGDLEKSPEVSCVYHSEEAENEYLKNPKRAVLGDGERAVDPNPSSITSGD